MRLADHTCGGAEWTRQQADQPVVRAWQRLVASMVHCAGSRSVPRDQQAIPFKSWRMIGREDCRRATVLNPRRLNAEAVPVNTLDVPPGRVVSTGYASRGWRLGPLSRFQGFSDESRHNPLSAIPAPYIETRDGPDRHIVDWPQILLATQPTQIVSWRELTPAYRPVAVKSQQPWWRTLIHDSLE
jgi:hypothetical protein